MSTLRSFMFSEFPFIDQYGFPAENITNTLHIASAGMLGPTLLHIAIAEIKDNDYYKRFEAEVNLSLEEAKVVLKHIQAFVDFNEGKPWNSSDDYHEFRFKLLPSSKAD